MNPNRPPAVLNRIQMELMRVRLDPLPHWSAQPSDDAYHWNILMRGPRETPYEGGVFELDAFFSDSYPEVAPRVMFKTRIYHPRVSGEGIIDHDILGVDWSPEITMEDVLRAIYGLLSDPQPQDRLRPEEPEMAEELMDIEDAVEDYKRTAREWTIRYAM